MPDIKPLSTLAEGFNEFFYINIAKIKDKLMLNVSTQNPSKYIEDEYQTDMRNRSPYASVPYGCHWPDKISPSKFMWT